MSKTFELPIDVLEIQFCFWNAKTFWSSFRGEMLYLVQSKMFWHSRNEIGFQKNQLQIQKFNWDIKAFHMIKKLVDILILDFSVWVHIIVT